MFDSLGSSVYRSLNECTLQLQSQRGGGVELPSGNLLELLWRLQFALQNSFPFLKKRKFWSFSLSSEISLYFLLLSGRSKILRLQSPQKNQSHFRIWSAMHIHNYHKTKNPNYLPILQMTCQPSTMFSISLSLLYFFPSSFSSHLCPWPLQQWHDTGKMNEFSKKNKTVSHPSLIFTELTEHCRTWMMQLSHDIEFV